jgi:hypothetical protein
VTTKASRISSCSFALVDMVRANCTPLTPGARRGRPAGATLQRLLGRDRAGLMITQPIEAPADVAFRHICQLGLEGTVSKRLGSRYESGLKTINPNAPALLRLQEQEWPRDSSFGLFPSRDRTACDRCRYERQMHVLWWSRSSTMFCVVSPDAPCRSEAIMQLHQQAVGGLILRNLSDVPSLARKSSASPADHFRVELLYRRGRRVELTPIGKDFFGHEEEAIQLLCAAQAREIGSLNIGALRPPDAMEISARLLKRHSNLNIAVTLGASSDILNGLRVAKAARGSGSRACRRTDEFTVLVLLGDTGRECSGTLARTMPRSEVTAATASTGVSTGGGAS